MEATTMFGMSCFGHNLEQCPKRVVINLVVVEAEVPSDWFTMVTSKKKNKGKNQQGGNVKKFNDVKVNNPNSSFQYRPVAAQKDTTKKKDDVPRDGITSLDTFDILRDNEDPLAATEVGESSRDQNKEEIFSSQETNDKDSDSNLPTERRLLWADLGLHKNVVRGFPWVLMGDFNVALNLEDYYSASSSLNYAMYEFKDCVLKIEVMDINSTGLHYTWNQKPKGGGVVSKMKALKNPLRKLVHDHGNLHDRVNKLRLELDEVQKALDRNPDDSVLRDEEVVYVTTFVEAKLDEELKNQNQLSRIEVIRDANDVEVTGSLVADAFVSHYHQFLGTSMVCEELHTEGLFMKNVFLGKGE
ncbi:aspartic peptidase [Tanacetum coccineum]